MGVEFQVKDLERGPIQLDIQRSTLWNGVTVSEIKSAIELAMERTKGLVMDDKEKQEAVARELGSRMGGLLRRYLEEMIDLDDFRKEYEKLAGNEAQKKGLLVEAALSEFDLSEDNQKVFDILSFAGGEGDDRLKREIDDLQSEFNNRMAAEVEGVRKSISARLEKMGISGNAVEPNVAEWDEWKSAMDQTKSFFKKRLAEWKTRIRQA